MPDQTLSTRLELDALLTSGYKDAFSSANDLMADLKKEGNDLRKELKRIGKEADEIEKVGDSADTVRRDMKLLERQIDETTKATAQFGNAKRHFRNASIGARAFKSDIGALIGTARNVSLAIAGIGTAAALALSPSEELQQFDQTLAAIAFTSPEVDTADIERAKMEIRELSNVYGVTATEIAMQHRQLTRNLGFDAAQQTISAAVEFQAATGLSIADIEEELATARISLGIDTSGETRQFLELLQQAHAQGIKIDNIDLGDLETLVSRTGEDVFGENFQREFLTTIAFRQVDSFQFADYAAAFEEEFGRAVTAAPQVDLKDALAETMRVGENLAILKRFGLRAEDGILGAMRAFQQLSDTQRSIFREQLSPVLGEETVEIIGRGSEALPRITQQVDAILMSERGLTDAAEGVADTWSGVWGRIGITGTNALGILQEQFAEVFGRTILQSVQRLFDYIAGHQQQIHDFFTGVRDGITPVIHRIWTSVKTAFPVVREFAMDVWAELSRQLGYVAPIARAVGDTIMDIARAVGSFLKEHPRLVATVLTGVVAWKAYQIAAGGIGAVASLVAGASSLMGGHIHRLNATILENARLQGTIQTASLSVSKVFSGIGKAALGAIPGIAALGSVIPTLIAPALPVILPVVAAVTALGVAGYVVYQNWEPIKAFFVDNFETIRTALLVLFPPLGLLVSFADIIRQNWDGVKEFFATIWGTVKLTFMVAFEAIKFAALNAVLAVTQAWSGITSFFGNLWSGVHDFFISTPLTPVFEWMANGIKAVVAPLGAFFNDFWDNIAAKAGEVLGWITDKFKALNDLLGRALGWLRDRNEEIQEEIKLVSEVNIDTPDMPALQIDAPALGAVDLNAPDSIDGNIEAPELPDISTLGLDVETGDDGEAVGGRGVAPVSIPELPAPRVDVPVQRSPELVNIGLGQLSEARKQTLLLADINKKEIAHEVKNIVEPPLVETSLSNVVETPQVGDAPQQMVESQQTGRDVEVDKEMAGVRPAAASPPAPAGQIIEFPPVVVIASPIVEVTTPSVEVPEIATANIQEETDRGNIERIKETVRPDVAVQNAGEVVQPAMDAQAIVQRDEVLAEVRMLETPVDREPSLQLPAMVETPEVVVVAEPPDVEVPTMNTVIDTPAVPEIQSPMVDIAATGITTPTPEVVNDTRVLEIQSPMVNVAATEITTPTPDVEVPTMNTVVESSAVPEIQSPMVNVAATEITTPTPEVMNDQRDIVSPDVTVEAVPAAAQDSIRQESPLLELPVPGVEVHDTVSEVGLDKDVVVQPAAMDIPAIETPVVNVAAPVVEVPQTEIINDAHIVTPDVLLREDSLRMVTDPVLLPDRSNVETSEMVAPNVELPVVRVPSPGLDQTTGDSKMASDVVYLPQTEIATIEVPQAHVIVDSPEVVTSTAEMVTVAMPDMRAGDMIMPPVTDAPVIDVPSVETAQLVVENNNVVEPVSQTVADIGSLEMPVVNIDNTPAIEVQEVTLPDAPPTLVLQEYEAPEPGTDTIERERIEERGSTDDGGAQTAPATNVTVNFTINQTPGQDPEELARVIMRYIDQSTETFLIQ